MSQTIPADHEEFEPSWDPTRLAVSSVSLLAVVSYIGAILTGFILFGRGILVGLGAVGLSVLTIALHECVHALVGKWYGCTVSFGIETDGWNLTPYVNTFGRFNTRTQQAIIAIAPVVSLTVLGLCGLLLVGPGTNLGLSMALALSVNILASVMGVTSDVNNTYRLLKLPPETRCKDSPDGRIFIRPETDSE